MSPPPKIKILSKQTIKPPPTTSPDLLCHLTPWDTAMLCAHYIQKGLLFTNLQATTTLISTLQTSLSLTLHHFPPLSGRLQTQTHFSTSHISIACNHQGAEFIHATTTEISSSDLLSQNQDIPIFVNSLFPLNGAIGHDGHSSPLLSVQLTQLSDNSIFLACCFSHVVGDGTSYWNFFNSWAQITRTCSLSLSLPPVHNRFFLDGQTPPVILPFSDPSQFLEHFTPPSLRQRFFHFSAKSIAKLKAKASNEIAISVSSFQALSAMIWRAITRARGLGTEEMTRCRLAIQNRGRMRPILSEGYFGNSIYAVAAEAKAGDLEEKGLGWAAGELNRVVVGHTDEAIRGRLREYHVAPVVYRLRMFDGMSVMMGSSPRFDMYGCDFGWGKPAAVRCGPGNKFDGKVSAFPGREGGGSVDLEICLVPRFMEALLVDPEFLDAISE